MSELLRSGLTLALIGAGFAYLIISAVIRRLNQRNRIRDEITSRKRMVKELQKHERTNT